ncbi:hypothetical protein FRB96_005843 [Tulasnella sp. 330]|nr:hypothetical protein FRB96_005843 [Tulasnella sp. 330]
MSQSNYTAAILDRFNMANCHTVATPMDISTVLTARTDNDPAFDKSVYAQAIGSLLYLAIATRPDIAYAVHKLSQYSQDPGDSHWTGIKRILRYLKGTADYGLVYGGPNYISTHELDSYTDSDFGTDKDQKSVSGYVFLLGGGAISWSAKKQGLVTVSSTEAEYVAACHATKNLIWLRQLCTDLGFPQPDCSTLWSDNQSAIILSRDAQFHARTKHIDIQYHYTREKVKQGALNLEYCPTQLNTADIFTKPLSVITHVQHRQALGVLQSEERLFPHAPGLGTKPLERVFKEISDEPVMAEWVGTKLKLPGGLEHRGKTWLIDDTMGMINDKKLSVTRDDLVEVKAEGMA